MGRGGVGAVYRVLDEARKETLALKILEHRDPKQLTSFEREYHTLASLRHPSVIEVYDYGRTDEGKPYYTMELLPGEDLLTLSPLSFEDACAHLCDVATSLSLLHARGLLHRDVSPRNVRLDSQGRAKLLDFGALVGFGRSDDIVGTPPCMSPEALEARTLDQRSDLFSLGAVAYYTLTRRMPFAGKTLEDARAAQRVVPVPPAELVRNLPPALNALVLQLLSLDPLARPNSAAEVIDRLSAMTNLERGSSTPLAEIYLRSPALIGRARECRQLKRHLARGRSGSGGIVLLQGAPGMGRTRLSAEFCVEAKLHGIAAVRIDALVHAAPGAAMRAIARGLLETLPELARTAMSARMSSLDALIKEPTARFQVITDLPERLSRAPSARDADLENEFVSFVLDIAGRSPLALAVDDAHALDGPSARALAHLAHRARRTRLVLLLTTPNDQPAAVLQPIRRIATQVVLRPLTAEELDELIACVFGEVPHRARLSQWLLGTGRGNPGQSLELLRALLERRMVRYAGGTWVLPQEFPEQDLPKSIEEALATRLATLDAVELTLLRSLALYRRTVPLATCLALLPNEPPERVIRTLERLLAQDLVLRSGDEFRFGRYAPRELVLSRITPDERGELHRRLADALLQTRDFLRNVLEQRAFEELSTDAVLTVLELSFHLQCSGRSALGTALIRDAAAELTLRGEGLADAVPTLEACVAEHAAAGFPEVERAPLLAPLALAGTYSDYRLSYRYGETVIVLLLKELGFSRAAKLQRFIGGHLALYVSLGLSFLRFKFTAKGSLARSFREALLGLVGVGTALLGTYSVLLDRERAQSIADRLATLRYFPAGHPLRLVHSLQSALLDAAKGDSAASARGAMGVFVELSSPKVQRQIPPEALLQLQVGCLTPSSLAFTQRLDDRALLNFTALDRAENAVSRQVAAGARAVYHGHRGERTKFNQYREEMDVLASRAGSTWREDVGTPRQMWSTYALCEDVLGLKRCSHDLDAVADDLSSIRQVRDAARACYLAERGKAVEALASYGPMFERVSDDGSLLGARFAGAYARILRLAGDARRAQFICQRALSCLDTEQLAYTLSVLGAQLELCLASAQLGQSQSALQQLDEVARSQGTHDNPLVHGLMHKTRAQVALWGGDAAGFAEQLSNMEQWFRMTENPSLFAQCQRLVKEARAQGLHHVLAGLGDADSTVDKSDFLTAFNACLGARDRLQLAIDVVLAETGAERVYLYLLGAAGLRFAAPTEGSEPPESVLSVLSEQLELLRRSAAELPLPSLATTVEERAAPTQEPFETFVPWPLYFWRGSELCVVGAMAIVPGALPLVAPAPARSEAMARAIHDAKDVRDIHMAEVDLGETVHERLPSGLRSTLD